MSRYQAELRITVALQLSTWVRKRERTIRTFPRLLSTIHGLAKCHGILHASTTRCLNSGSLSGFGKNMGSLRAWGVWLRPHVRSSFPLTPCRPCTSSAWPWPEEKRKREHLRKSEHHGYARHSTAKLCGIFREICQALSAQPGCQAAQRVHRGLIEALDAVLRAEPFQFLQNPSTWSLYKPLQKTQSSDKPHHQSSSASEA